MSCRDRYLPQYNGSWSRNFVDWLRLDINTVGCWLSGLSVKCSGARLVDPGFEFSVAGSWMHTVEESHNRMKRSSSAFSFSMVV